MLKIYACVPERRLPCLCEPSFFFSVIFDMPCVSWSGFASFSLSHTLLYTHSHTHTHTHMHTDTYISLSLTCLSFQSAFALLCSATCSHSSNQSLYLQRLRSRLSAGLLYVMLSCVLFSSQSLVFVPCLVPPGDAEGFWLLLGVLLPHPFCVYDRLPCFALLLKTVLTILCVWILTFPFVTE